MKYTIPVLALLLCATSCTWVNKKLFPKREYLPIYLQKPSPMDPPGMDHIREEARKKLVKEGMYPTGDTVEVQHGKAYLFYRNPDNTSDTEGRMVDAKSAKILSCEGLYYFVETDGGDKGFLRETDFVSPIQMVGTGINDMGMMPGVDGIPGEVPFMGTGSMFPEEGVPVPGNTEQLMTDRDGRTVLVVGRASEKTDAFEQRRRELEAAAQQNQSQGGPEDAPLPEPAGGDF